MLSSFPAAFFIIIVLVTILLAYKNNTKQATIRKQDLLFQILGLIILIGLVAASFQNLENLTLTKPSPNMIIGATIFIVSLLIRISAHITLNTNYSWALEIREGHRLIKNGLYRYVRHPIYLGTILGAISIPVFTSSLYGFLVSLFSFPLFRYRIILEEQMLIEEFGDEYLRYIKNTWRLIPYLY